MEIPGNIQKRMEIYSKLLNDKERMKIDRNLQNTMKTYRNKQANMEMY